MTASKAQRLSKLFRSAVKGNSSTSISAGAERDLTKSFVSSVDTSSSSSVSEAIVKRKQKLRKFSKKRSSAVGYNDGVFRPSFGVWASKTEGGSMNGFSVEISSILPGGTSDGLYETQETDDETHSGGALEIPWISSTLQSNITLRRKEVSRDRKQKWIFSHSQVSRFDRLVRMCASKLGTDATIQVFGKLGRETGRKEYNALIGICIENARSSDDDEVALQQFYKAFQLFKSMREEGFQLEEETYGPFLRYLVERGMEQEFHFFCDVIKEGNPKSVSRLGYYEMLLRIEVNDREKIQELSNYIVSDNGEENIHLQENYLLALCESGAHSELVQVIERIDITKISSRECVSSVFEFLGKASLESFAEKFLLELKTCEYGADYVSDVIFNYVINIPNLAVFCPLYRCFIAPELALFLHWPVFDLPDGGIKPTLEQKSSNTVGKKLAKQLGVAWVDVSRVTQISVQATPKRIVPTLVSSTVGNKQRNASDGIVKHESVSSDTLNVQSKSQDERIRPIKFTHASETN